MYGIIWYAQETRLNKEERKHLEHLLKAKGLEFEIIEPIAPETLTLVIHQLFQKTELYLDNVQPEYPIKYLLKQKLSKSIITGK